MQLLQQPHLTLPRSRRQQTVSLLLLPLLPTQRLHNAACCTHKQQQEQWEQRQQWEQPQQLLLRLLVATKTHLATPAATWSNLQQIPLLHLLLLLPCLRKQTPQQQQQQQTTTPAAACPALHPAARMECCWGLPSAAAAWV
jgi:hypothetical protein